MLEDFALDSSVVERVTLLHSSSVGKEFRKLPFRSTEMKTIFCTMLPRASDSTITTVSWKRSRTADDETNPVTQTKRSCPVTGIADRCDSVTPQRSRYWTDRTIWVDAAGQRVDSRLPEPSQAVVGSWTEIAKKAKLRFCRVHHMNGNCRGGCGYSHSPLSDEERLAFRKSLREQVCHIGLSCRDFDCYYGHNCSCKRAKCKFSREMHGVDTATAEVWKP